ncbi:hypothetical protein GCM10023321_02960 [Pseudonocardia eucalypti]|uniref:Uncharacterized protein n=1 Tax=Pseudonocardia eucalypti TaxID=648755 RepID=A0ABP9PEG4_9PSEU
MVATAPTAAPPTVPSAPKYEPNTDEVAAAMPPATTLLMVRSAATALTRAPADWCAGWAGGCGPVTGPTTGPTTGVGTGPLSGMAGGRTGAAWFAAGNCRGVGTGRLGWRGMRRAC